MSWGARHAGTAITGLRERIVATVRNGSSMSGAAARFSVSASSAIKLMARYRATGSVATERYGGHRWPILSPHEDLLRALIAERPDITLAEIREELRQQRGIPVCVATIHVRLHRLGLRFKKKYYERLSRTAPMSPRGDSAGGSGSATWMRRGSSFWTRRG